MLAELLNSLFILFFFFVLNLDIYPSHCCKENRKGPFRVCASEEGSILG